jgi:hypothetical protein
VIPVRPTPPGAKELLPVEAGRIPFLEVSQKTPDILDVLHPAGGWDHATPVEIAEGHSRFAVQDGNQQVVPLQVAVGAAETVNAAQEQGNVGEVVLR